MKTLTIERPAGLETCNRTFVWKMGDLDLRDHDPRKLFDLEVALRGDNTSMADLACYRMLDEGVVMVVDEGVSRDLEVSAMSGDLSHLVWPAKVMEMRFQDPGLPAVIVSHIEVCERRDGPITGDGITVVVQQKEECGHMMMHLCIPSSRFEQWVVENQDIPDSRADEKLNESEAAIVRYMSLLAVKVLAYASVPQHRPALLTTRAELKEAGIHPKHVFTGRKNMVVRYLPVVIRDKPAVPEGGGSGDERRFMGRRGYIRHYQSEFYVNMKGRWQWMPPIPPPAGIQVVYKVRKVA